jgi:hypothetical protein
MNRLTSVALTVAALSTILATACAPVQVATPGAAASMAVLAASNPAIVPSMARSTIVSPGPGDAASASAVTIDLADPGAANSPGVVVAGTTVTMTAGGTYRLTGVLADGQVVVAARDAEPVQLILDGAGITSSTSAALYVKSAKSAAIVLADGSQSALVDGATRASATPGSDEPNAALYSAVDLTIGGTGALAVDARYNDGIASKDDLELTGGTITVTSVAEGIRGRDSLDINGGTITVSAGQDGLKSSNDEDPEKGVVAITAGTVQVTAREDGIQAETNVVIDGGTVAILAGGGSATGKTADVSAKGIKGTAGVAIDGGSLTVDAADDAVHSNGSLAVGGGTLLLRSGDDGLHADASLDIAGGEITIADSNEGIESARIAISDGLIRLRSRDDGLYVASGTSGAAPNGWPGQGRAATASNDYVSISGGSVTIDSDTDGIDANGSIEMSGGTVIVHGPTASFDGALDYDGSFTITGGTLIAAGSAGMAQAPGTTSTQPSVRVTFPTSQPAGTVVHIGTASGEELLTFVPTKAYQSLVVSSPDLEIGGTYLVYTGGSSTGTITDGLYSGGTYTVGTQVTSFTVAGAVTDAGSANVGTGRGGGPRR